MKGSDTIVSRFEHHVRSTPDQVALVLDGFTVSYRNLDTRANQLAARLDKLRIQPDDLVGLVASRSVDLVAGILAILKAGGAYLPLDPMYPRDRLAFMLEDAAPVALLVQREHHAELPAFSGPVIVLDEPAADPQAAIRSPEVRSGPGNLAYVIYTSGSTGRPKGVMISHAHVIRLLDATYAWFAFGASDVWTLFHSYAFDFSVWELWGALLYGGSLIIVPYLTSRSSEEFYQLVLDERVTVLNQTPSAFRQFITADKTAGSPPDALALRYVIFGGEALDFSMLAPWFERHGDARPQLVNMFGITETTVHVTYRPIRAADIGSPTSPIGVAIPDLVLHVLDGQLAPASIGEPGEIYVGGAGVARGYLQRPALTAERFVPDPTSSRPGARLYRSGDLGQRRGDGDLDFLGRADDQIKIRGFRIEPGEIASVIAGHPGVDDAVVVPWRPDNEPARLVAYVIAKASALTATTELVASLRLRARAQLPDYMQPAAFVVVDRFPLTDNGKLDRRALPTPDTIRPSPPNIDEAPATPLEQELMQLWTELLGVPISSTSANFFELGGHSLILIQLANRVRAAFGVDLHLGILFDTPTIALLAREITDRLAPPENDDTDDSVQGLLSQLDGLSPEEVERLLSESD